MMGSSDVDMSEVLIGGPDAKTPPITNEGAEGLRVPIGSPETFYEAF